MINKTDSRSSLNRFHSHYSNDFARPNFEKLTPSSSHLLPPADQIYAEARKTSAGCIGDERCTYCNLLHMYIHATIMYIYACRPRPVMKDRHRLKITKVTPTCALNWAKYMIIDNLRALSDLV